MSENLYIRTPSGNAPVTWSVCQTTDRACKTMKNVFLFHLKSSFRSRDIQIFVIFSLLSTLSRFKRANGIGIIYDVINWFA